MKEPELFCSFCGRSSRDVAVIPGADGNICVARSARISLLGVKNLVVVTTPDSVLVADKTRLTEMKRLFA